MKFNKCWIKIHSLASHKGGIIENNFPTGFALFIHISKLNHGLLIFPTKKIISKMMNLYTLQCLCPLDLPTKNNHNDNSNLFVTGMLVFLSSRFPFCFRFSPHAHAYNRACTYSFHIRLFICSTTPLFLILVLSLFAMHSLLQLQSAILLLYNFNYYYNNNYYMYTAF